MTSATGDIISPDIIMPQKTIINYSSSLSSLAVFSVAVVGVVVVVVVVVVMVVISRSPNYHR